MYVRVVVHIIFTMFFFLGACDHTRQENYKSSNGSITTSQNTDDLDLHDSIKIRRLIDQSDKYRYSGRYGIAFDNLWEALLLAKNRKEDIVSVEIYRDIGILYDIYSKDSLALHYLHRALSLSKSIMVSDQEVKEQIVSNYFSIATFWRDRHKYEVALTYLDSCNQVYDNGRILPYAMTDQGFCNMKVGNITLSEKQLVRARSYLEKKNAPYLAMNLAFTADLKKELYQYDSAHYYYQKSLEWIRIKQVHIESEPAILQKIADVHILQGNWRSAVDYLKASREVNDKLFSTTSKLNEDLFEIKNKYRAQLEKNKITIAQQQVLIKEEDKKLTGAIILFAIILTLGTGVYIVFYQRSKFKRLSMISQHKIEKNEAILEVKNKELTGYALKVIKMQENIDFLVDLIKIKAPAEYTEYKKKYSHINTTTWNEFNKRFTEVNTEFYKTICNKHPELTPTELKHCALIKLNFNNYEMSKILNISLRSVHTSRYRIKKKIGLDANSSLTNYIRSL
ncbi:hypothetical protein NBT05_03415 [Aquimarina sp. ERC-38]|uniref:helix-turn-helix transcriptional regulator n=1 Tax=Aquimarina sp. ERC-38 TaxID=2949996 RepID=UPI002245A226|nr:hypothetical protein [Aquimarina sp. ERC-38]UZO81529.1 hypothetical protein NBT05_03415 [Aquimarina sp. ERC-38]